MGYSLQRFVDQLETVVTPDLKQFYHSKEAQEYFCLSTELF